MADVKKLHGYMLKDEKARNDITVLKARINQIINNPVSNATGWDIVTLTQDVQVNIDGNITYTFDDLPEGYVLLEASYIALMINDNPTGSWHYVEKIFSTTDTVQLEIDDYTASTKARLKLVYSYLRPFDLSELEDIRVAWDGNTYSTAGLSVRAQIGDIQRDLADLSGDINLLEQSLSDLEEAVNDLILTADWDATQGEDGYIANKPFRLIDNNVYWVEDQLISSVDYDSETGKYTWVRAVEVNIQEQSLEAKIGDTVYELTYDGTLNEFRSLNGEIRVVKEHSQEYFDFMIVSTDTDTTGEYAWLYTRYNSSIYTSTEFEKCVNEVVELPDPITVDSALNNNSTNPVQNKVIKRELDDLDSRLYALEHPGE